jgi:signal transduction histidine kinase
MDRDAALSLLASDAPQDRLKAARYFVRHAVRGDSGILRRALQTETVSWVRRRLELAIWRVRSANIEPLLEEPSPPDVDDRSLRLAHTKAVEDVTRQLLHEIEPIVGVLRLRAMEDVPDFETSRVKKELERLNGVIDALRSLSVAAQAGRREEIDLSALVRDVVAAEISDPAVSLSLAGPAPMLMGADPKLLRLAIANGLRNAAEATMTNPEGGREIVVNWGQTDIENWLVIIDNGEGFSSPTEAAFSIGTTTKRNHFGMGLPTARQAMASMDGTASLSSGSRGGARFELRWDK